MSEAIKLPTARREGTVLDDTSLAAVRDDPGPSDPAVPTEATDADTTASVGTIARAAGASTEPVGVDGEEQGSDPSDDEPSLVDLEARWRDAASEPWQPPSVRRRRRRARAAAGAVLVTLLAVIGYGAWRIHDDDQLAAARSSALAAGKADAQLISTYTYQDFAAYSKKIVATSTKTFSDNYTKDAGSLGTILAQYQAGSKGSVLAAGLEPGTTTSKAVVDVFLNETVTNSKDSGPQSERARMVVTLVRHGGHWLIANAIVE